MLGPLFLYIMGAGQLYNAMLKHSVGHNKHMNIGAAAVVLLHITTFLMIIPHLKKSSPNQTMALCRIEN
jgi:hypothetical protein